MNYDPLDTCPYDPVHRILRSRMQFHLTRCSQNFPCTKMKQCPFDARHIINQMEFNYHLSTCPGRESVWHYKIKNEEAEKLQNIVPIESEPIAASEESWDNDVEVKSYDPTQNIQDRPVMRILIGASKAKRKQFRMQERRRIQEIDEQSRRQEKAAACSAAQTKKVVDDDDDDEQEYKPLRRPNKLPSDSFNVSELSLDTSTISVENENRMLQNKSMQKNQPSMSAAVPAVTTAALSSLSSSSKVSMQQNSIKRDGDTPALKTVPFSYAAALNKKSVTNMPISEESYEYDDVVIEGVKYDNEKESITNNSFFSQANESFVEKLSKTVEDLNIEDEGYKKKTEPLNRRLEKYRNLNSSSSNSNNNNPNAERRSTRLAATFPVFK